MISGLYNMVKSRNALDEEMRPGVDDGLPPVPMGNSRDGNDGGSAMRDGYGGSSGEVGLGCVWGQAVNALAIVIEHGIRSRVATNALLLLQGRDVAQCRREGVVSAVRLGTAEKEGVGRAIDVVAIGKRGRNGAVRPRATGRVLAVGAVGPGRQDGAEGGDAPGGSKLGDGACQMREVREPVANSATCAADRAKDGMTVDDGTPKKGGSEVGQAGVDVAG